MRCALERLEQRFSAWRKTRQPGDRILASLWKAGVYCGRDVGLNRTAMVLKLDYDSLRKHVDLAINHRFPDPSGAGKG